MLGGLVLLAAFGLWLTGPVYWTCLLVLWGILRRVRGWLVVSAVLAAAAAFSAGYSGLGLANEGRFSGEMRLSLALGSGLWALASVAIVHIFSRIFPHRTVRL